LSATIPDRQLSPRTVNLTYDSARNLLTRSADTGASGSLIVSVMAPVSQEKEPSELPGRFRSLAFQLGMPAL